MVILIGCSTEPTSTDTIPTDTTTVNDTTSSNLFGRFDGDTAEGGACIWVAPYRRTDGTCVRGHWTSAPGQKCSRVGSVYENCP